MKKILGILCVFVIALMLTACGSKGLSGTYKLVEMESAGQKVDASGLASYGITMELTIKDEKNAVLVSDGEEKPLTYDDKYFTGVDDTTGETRSISYEVSGSKIILTDDGEKLIFQK